jgi:ribose 5-phosphate isomerase B
MIGAQPIAGAQVLVDPYPHCAIVLDHAGFSKTAWVRIAIAADHAGYPLKAVLVPWLEEQGHLVSDLGTDSEVPVDYPPLCAAGIVLGGSGQGEQIAANKVRGVRAALCHDIWMARMARSHNDANVLSMGARVIASAMAKEIATVFLTTSFEGERHAARVRQLADIENEEAQASGASGK